MGLSDTWNSYCLDNAIWLLGWTIENELEAVTGRNDRSIKNQRDQILRKWIPEANKARKFKEPGAGKR